MSHYTVTVCLPADIPLENLDEALDRALAPFDENTTVAPYRDYLTGDVADNWFVAGVRRSAAKVKERGGVENVPFKRDELFGALLTEAQLADRVAKEREAFEQDVRDAEALGDLPTWADVVRVYNDRYHPRTELAVVGGDDENHIDTRLRYDEKTGQAYEISTYNPNSKWDWWQIGGRWKGYFVAKEPAPGMINGEPDVFGEQSWDDTEPLVRCDGGPISIMDFEKMRDLAVTKASAEYDKWEAVVRDVERWGVKPEDSKPWSDFYARVKQGELRLDEARERYHAQPLIRAMKDVVGLFGPCPIDKFSISRDEYVDRARRAAVPTYALLTLDGEWVAPGEMGCFGMSSDEQPQRDAYHRRFTEYLESLDPATIIVVLDCHI